MGVFFRKKVSFENSKKPEYSVTLASSFVQEQQTKEKNSHTVLYNHTQGSSQMNYLKDALVPRQMIHKRVNGASRQTQIYNTDQGSCSHTAEITCIYRLGLDPLPTINKTHLLPLPDVLHNNCCLHGHLHSCQKEKSPAPLSLSPNSSMCLSFSA